MPDPAITIDSLGKRYTIGHRLSRSYGLRHAIEGVARAPIAALRSFRQKRSQRQDFWALKNISLQIAHGEVIGIIGRNGAGKSTLLKILSRITVPTEGRILMDGRTGSLLEVGTGFHQELTGRENIFLNGAILGMTRAEISRKFDEIVDFSGVEEFLDTPVKHYSSGMYVRLAFAVAAHLEPEILIVDEVLAVGDVAFQKKCLGKMGSFARSGRTVLFVSHNMDTVRNLCNRCIWLKDGMVYKDGSTDDVIDRYFTDTFGSDRFFYRSADYGLEVTRVVLRNMQGERCNRFQPGEDLVVAIDFDASVPIEKPHFILSIHGINGSCFTANMLLDGCRPSVLMGQGSISCRFKSLPLLPQHYSVKMSLRSSNGDEKIIDYNDVADFAVVANLENYGYRGEFLSRAHNSTPVVIPYEWRLPDGSCVAMSLERPVLSPGYCTRN